MNLAKLLPVTYTRNISKQVIQRLTRTNLTDVSVPAVYTNASKSWNSNRLLPLTTLISKGLFQNPSSLPLKLHWAPNDFRVAQNGSPYFHIAFNLGQYRNYSTITCCSSPQAYRNNLPFIWTRSFCRYRNSVAVLQSSRREREKKLKDLSKELSRNAIVPPHVKLCEIAAVERACPICHPNLEILRQKASMFSSCKGSKGFTLVEFKPIGSHPQPTAAETVANVKVIDDKDVKSIAVEDVAPEPPPCNEDTFITILDLCKGYEATQKKLDPPLKALVIKQEPPGERNLMKVSMLKSNPEEAPWEDEAITPEVVIISSEQRCKCMGVERYCRICYPSLEVCFG